MNPKFTNSARYKCLEYLKKHSVDLYLCYCGMEECDPGHYYGPTSRSEYLIHYVLSGKGIFQADGKTYHIGENNAFIICPDEVTFYQADEEDPWTYIWIGFGGAKAETCLNYASLNRENRVGVFKCKNELVSYVKGMLNASKLTYANDLKREGYLFMFLAALINESNANEQHNTYDYPYQTYVEHALEFIDNYYDKDIKVNDIANYIGIDRSYLTNVFKKIMHVSPHQYLINYRLEKARNLIKKTNLSISEVSERIGYSDPLYFSKLFKKYYNISPTEFRTQIEELVRASKKGE